MQSERQDNIFEQFGEEIEEWARNAKSLINFFHNEYTVINSTSTYGDDFPKLEEIVDEYGTSIRQGMEKNRGGIRDISSARKIAFRKGKIWNSCK